MFLRSPPKQVLPGRKCFLGSEPPTLSQYSLSPCSPPPNQTGGNEEPPFHTLLTL